MLLLNDVCDMLSTYGGRDKIMKTLCYTTKLAAGLQANGNPHLASQLATFSKKISQARATLRLVDDIPMLQYSLEYGVGKKEPDSAMAALGLMANIVDHIYYPIDKICWFSEHNIIKLKNAEQWDTINTWFWVMSIYLNLMKTIRYVALMESHKKCLNKVDSESSVALEKLVGKQRMEIISIMRLTLDLLQAGSCLPAGYLWGGKLKSWHVGFIGSASAFIGIYQYFAKKK